MLVPELISLGPRFVQNVMQVLDVRIEPHLGVTKFERLECVVPVRQRQELVIEHLSQQVLVWKFVRLDSGISV